jgi:V/A-type H+/Na+-transporting ATPase subunit I
MFSPAPMVRVSALVLKRDERALLYGLGRAGVVHLARSESDPQTTPLATLDESPALATCEALLDRIEMLRGALGIEDLPPLDDPVALTADQVDERLSRIERATDELVQRRRQVEQQWSQVTMLLDQIAAYENLDLPLEQLAKFAFLHFAIGTLPGEKLDALRHSTEENVVLLPLSTQGDRLPVVAVTSRKGRFAMETALKQSGFRHEKLPSREGSDIRELADESRSEQRRLAVELEQVQEQHQRFARSVVTEVALLEQAVREEHAILQAQTNFTHTESAVLISGWAPAECAAALEAQLKQITGDRCVIRVEQPGDVPVDQIPVLLRQPRWLRPFAALVSGYGLPGYRDVQPTLLVAITYMLMFGVMFGDVGHGGVLAIGGLVAMFFLRDEKHRDYGVLVLMAGLSSMLFGAVYGSYFGLPALHHLAIWHEPLHDPVSLMMVAIGVGVVIVSMGIVLNIVNSFRRGEFVSGVLDKFGVVGIIFYWGSLLFIVRYSMLDEMGLAGLVLVVAITLPLLAMTLKEPLQYALSRRAGRKPHAENVFVAFIESAIEAFEAVLAYLANTISFVRLAAYAMSHAAILMATFAMAEAVGKTPGVGIVLYVIIAVIGNLIALVLEGVVVAVQVLRLEYYEFFGKFFSGGGLPFRPFSFLDKERKVS